MWRPCSTTPPVPPPKHWLFQPVQLQHSPPGLGSQHARLQTRPSGYETRQSLFDSDLHRLLITTWLTRNPSIEILICICTHTPVWVSSDEDRVEIIDTFNMECWVAGIGNDWGGSGGNNPLLYNVHFRTFFIGLLKIKMVYGFLYKNYRHWNHFATYLKSRYPPSPRKYPDLHMSMF